MTYCYAFKFRSSVYLFADSAVTHDAPAPVSTDAITAFGEASVALRNRRVSEGALKIVAISQDCMLAIAGDATRAFNAAQIFRSLYSRQTPIPELLAKVSSNLGVDDASRFEFLIARQIDSGPELWHWSSALPNAAVEVETSMRIGSLASWHAEMSSALTTMFTQGNLDESRMLVVLAASIQSYGLRDSLMGQGVGGTVAAVRLSTDGPEWLPDTNYVVDLGQLSDIALVSVLIRENGVAVASSFSQDVRVMLNSVNHGTGRDWMRKWQASVRSQFALSASRLWIFLGTTNATLLIVDAEAVVTETPIFTVARSAEWGYTFGMHPLLKAVLEEPLLAPDRGSLPFRITYTKSSTCLEHLTQFMAARQKQRGG